MKQPLFSERFRCKPEDMRRDSWRYGNYTQYLCKRRDGSYQTARVSSLPFTCLLIGVMLATSVCFAAWVGQSQPDEVVWRNVYIMAGVAGLFLAVPIGAWLGNFNYMVSTSPRWYGDKRLFWHEIDKDEYYQQIADAKVRSGG